MLINEKQNYKTHYEESSLSLAQPSEASHERLCEIIPALPSLVFATLPSFAYLESTLIAKVRTIAQILFFRSCLFVLCLHLR